MALLSITGVVHGSCYNRTLPAEAKRKSPALLQLPGFF